MSSARILGDVSTITFAKIIVRAKTKWHRAITMK